MLISQQAAGGRVIDLSQPQEPPPAWPVPQLLARIAAAAERIATALEGGPDPAADVPPGDPATGRREYESRIRMLQR